MVQEQKIRTIQLTSKIWKAGQVIGCILLVIGVIGLFRAYFVTYFANLNQALEDSGTPATTPLHVGVWLVILSVGLIIYLSFRIAAWWFHG